MMYYPSFHSMIIRKLEETSLHESGTEYRDTDNNAELDMRCDMDMQRDHVLLILGLEKNAVHVIASCVQRVRLTNA